MGSGLQFCMHILLAVSGLDKLPNSLPGHMACCVLMPLRLGMRACTSAMFLSDKT